MVVNVLGSEYSVTVKKFDEDDFFRERSCDGYCNRVLREIVLCDMSTYPGYEHETPETYAEMRRETLRHELVHAFLAESGLAESANTIDGAWAENEEMVDWFARQGPKIYAAWQAAGAV